MREREGSESEPPRRAETETCVTRRPRNISHRTCAIEEDRMRKSAQPSGIFRLLALSSGEMHERAVANSPEKNGIFRAREASSSLDRESRRRNAIRDGPPRHSFASPSRTPVIHSSGGVCCDRCVPTNIAVSLASPATGSLPVRGGIFRRARPSPHFSFPKPPTPVIGRVRRVATVRGGEVRAAIHVQVWWG